MTSLLTVDEVAHRLRVSRRTVTTLVATGELRSLLVRRRRRVPEAEYEAFVEAGLNAISTK